MGFSSLAAARAIHQIIDSGIPIAGTTRTEKGIEALADCPYWLHLFDGELPGKTLAADLRRATHVVLSIHPPRPAILPCACIGPTSTQPTISNGSATIRRWASMAISAARGSTSRADPADQPAQRAPRRSRAAMARLRAGARRAAAGAPPRRHLRSRPLGLRQAARRDGAAHRQAGPGVQPHPCRGYRPRSRRWRRSASSPARSISPTTSRRRRRT